MAASLQHLIRDYLEDYCREHDGSLPEGRLYELVMAQAEKPLIECALACCDGNQSKAAAWLGIHRNTLLSKMRSHGLVEDATPRDKPQRRRVA